jgi:hypothetical protein
VAKLAVKSAYSSKAIKPALKECYSKAELHCRGEEGGGAGAETLRGTSQSVSTLFKKHLMQLRLLLR